MAQKKLLTIAAILIFGMVLFGCAGIPPAEVLEPSERTATVYFMMGSPGVTLTGGGLTFGAQFSLWNGDTFLSNIGGKEYLVLNFLAGNQYFMASGDNWYISQAELAPGKTYFYEITMLPGYNRPNALLHIMDPDDPEIDDLLKKCKEISPKGSTSESYIQLAGRKLNEAINGSENIDFVPASKGR
ncbi:MAG: hypothetical protein FWG46_03100 [Treponema sp.]|nr:hypothetical protein [Treponema sp.]